MKIFLLLLYTFLDLPAQAFMTCELGHLSRAEAQEQLLVHAEKNHASVEVIEYLQSQGHPEQLMALTLLEKAPAEKASKLFERLGQTVREHGAQLSFKAQLLEIFHRPRYLERNLMAQEKARAAFNHNPNPLPAVEVLSNLSDEELRYYRAYKHMEQHFSSTQAADDLLELQDEVYSRLLINEPKLARLDGYELGSAESRELKKIMLEYEAAVELGEVIRLKRYTYSPEEWMKMLREGTPFYDTLQVGASHGGNTHRLQYHLILRDMRRNPEAYQGLTAKQLFSKLGDEELHNKVRPYLPKDGPKYVWDYIFDSMAKRNYTSPEFLRSRSDLYPNMSSWD